MYVYVGGLSDEKVSRVEKARKPWKEARVGTWEYCNAANSNKQQANKQAASKEE